MLPTFQTLITELSKGSVASNAADGGLVRQVTSRRAESCFREIPLLREGGSKGKTRYPCSGNGAVKIACCHYRSGSQPYANPAGTSGQARQAAAASGDAVLPFEGSAAAPEFAALPISVHAHHLTSRS